MAAVGSGNPTPADERDREFNFLPEGAALRPTEEKYWRVLAVDDDDNFQRSTAYALDDVRIEGRLIDLVQAYSMQEAAGVLARDRNFAVILLDVVMETDDAGLRLVKCLRETLGMAEARIVLVTGQPGVAPIDSVMRDYDINDYCLKSDLSAQRLRNTLTAAFRSYAQVQALSDARRGLHLIIESSNRLLGRKTLRDYSAGALEEIASLLRLTPEGIVCVRADQLDPPLEKPVLPGEAVVIGAAGRFIDALQQPLHSLGEPDIENLLTRSLHERTALEQKGATVLFFQREIAGADYAVYLATGRPLDDTERELLRVFAMNISAGFQNASLVSRLDRIAYEDQLLGLPNRNALVRALNQRLGSPHHVEDSLVMLDIDDFAGLNDAFGLAFGDIILHELASRMQAAFPAPNVVARLHSDIFAVVGHRSMVSMSALARVMDAPFRVGSLDYKLSACLSEMPVRESWGDGPNMLRSATRGLREAKRAGAGTHMRYDAATEQAAANRFALLQQLLLAIPHNELYLTFQPQVRLSDGVIVGVEALIRWKHGTDEMSPDEFVPIAETSSWIVQLGEFVVDCACDALRRLDKAGFPGVVVSVNVSARQFEYPDLGKSILRRLAEAGISPRRVELEVTETAAMRSFDIVATQLAHYRDGGGLVAIDDFGTGLSSLGYLLELPADHLKIDRTFVSRLESSEKDRAIARMILDLGHKLGIQVVAEGVETVGQATWLRSNGYDIGQGWLYGPPMSVERLIDRLRHH
ncbi:MAG: EAL domain-containing protein [Zoogloea sp.]|nr:EAL domain-containing protein [Zoogloea sp.]